MDENAASLLPDEEIALFTRPHWMSLLPALAAAAFFTLIALLMILSGKAGPSLSLILKIFMVGMLGTSLYNYWVFKNTSILVTNRRLMLQRNLIVETTSSEFLLAKTQTIGIRQPILGTLLGYGTITLSGTGGANEVFPYVMDPQTMRTVLQQQVEAATQPAPPAREDATSERRLGPVAGV